MSGLVTVNKDLSSERDFLNDEVKKLEVTLQFGTYQRSFSLLGGTSADNRDVHRYHIGVQVDWADLQRKPLKHVDRRPAK